MCQYFGLDVMDIQVESGSGMGKRSNPGSIRAGIGVFLCRGAVLIVLTSGNILPFGQPPGAPPPRPLPARNQITNQIQVEDPTQNVIPSSLSVQVKDGKINASIKNVPLQQVLEELALRSGIIFQIQSQDNPAVSITLQGVSLTEAIQRIASADDLIFYHGMNSSGQNVIQLVKIYPRGEVPQQPSIRYIGSGAVTRTNEDSGGNPQ